MVHQYINKSPVVVSQETSISDVVTTMVDMKISSALVQDETQRLTGIITERDILRKFTLLDMGDKLSKSVNTIMSRPLSYVNEKSLETDIIKLFTEKRLRHFPVINGPEPKLEYLVGIVSITNLLDHYLSKGADTLSADNNKKNSEIQVGLLNYNPEIRKSYELNLKPFDQFRLLQIDNFNDHIREHGAGKLPIIFDLDSFSQSDLKDLIILVKNYKAPVLTTTSNPAIAQAFKIFSQGKTRSLCLKPLDPDFIWWLFSEKWKSESP